MTYDRNLPSSVVITTYNSSQYIDECLQALFKELSNLNSEIIIVDNNSTDETLEIIRNFIKSDSVQNVDIRLITNDSNTGYAPANNKGVNLSSGEKILLLHPDVFIRENSIKTMIDYLDSESDVGMIAPQIQFPGGKIQASCRRFPNYWSVINESLGLTRLFSKSKFFNSWKMGKMGDFDHKSFREVDQPMGACVMVKRITIEKTGNMDERFLMFFNDVDWCKRIKDAGWKIVFNPDAVVEHVLGGSVRQVRSSMILQSHIGFYRYFEKHFRTPWQRGMNQIMGLILFISALPRVILNSVISSTKVRSR